MYRTRTIKTAFNGSSGHQLDARLEMPITEQGDTPRAYAVFCHCFTCTKDTITTFRISRELAARGYAVLRFDFTGLGSSKGQFSKTNFTTNVGDLLAAVEHLRRHYQAPALLMGHSLGGTAAVEAAMHVDEVRAAVTVASPSQPDHVLHHFGPALSLLQNGRQASINVAGQQYEIDPQFIEDLEKYHMDQRFAAMDKPVLIFNIVNDALVGESNADELQQWIHGDTELVTITDSDHLLSNKKDTELVANKIVEWFENLRQE